MKRSPEDSLHQVAGDSFGAIQRSIGVEPIRRQTGRLPRMLHPERNPVNGILQKSPRRR